MVERPRTGSSRSSEATPRPGHGCHKSYLFIDEDQSVLLSFEYRETIGLSVETTDCE